MTASLRRLVSMAGVAAISLGAVAASAQTSTTSETTTKKFQVIAVNGNNVVLKDATGTREYTVPPDFKATVDGKPMVLADLKPGMNGTATITTTTTVHPVRVTEVKNGEVMQASGSSLIVRTPTGIKMFSPGDVTKRNITIMKDGRPVEFSDLHSGDKLSATIITEGPPKVMTSRQVTAAMSGAPAAAAPSAAPAAKAAPAASTASKPAASGAEAPAAPRKLPKTATAQPLLGLAGAAMLGAGALLTFVRRRRDQV